MAKTKFVETLVVGAGPAGIFAAQELAVAAGATGESVLLIESSDHLGGRSRSALHLVDAHELSKFPVLSSTQFMPVKVRWEKQWKSANQVDWNDKEWVESLPQWQGLLSEAPKTLLLDCSLQEAPANLEILYKSPVNKLSYLENPGEQGAAWLVETPTQKFETKKLVWAAGLKSFQNAFGKQEAQDFMTGNDSYAIKAADFRGGVGLDLHLSKAPEWEPGFDPDSAFAIPMRFNGKLHLIVGVLHFDGAQYTLKTLTHVHQELLSDPKTISTFQKSLRRALKTLIGESDEGVTEKWVVNDRVMGHVLGTPWVFKKMPSAASIQFVGDETQVAVESRHHDTLGALISAESLGT